VDQDFLAEVIRDRSAKNPNFPALVKAAERRRELLQALTEAREASGLTQTEVAAAMGTSQSQVARLESAGVDAKLSTIEKLAAVLGKQIEWRISDATAANLPVG
jgi:ribosome-binding protein aMBF1 (putative translation factor)